VILVPSKKSSKKHAVGTRKKSRAAKRLQKPHQTSSVKKSAPRVLKPDINVRRSAYSKVARLAVLASAEARQKLIEVGGENTIDIIREFDRDMSDEELARKTGVKTSDVRVVLNRLHSCGLFTYTRVRDRESGWYSYIWKMSEGRLKDFADGAQPDAVNVDEGQGEAESDRYLEKNLVMQDEPQIEMMARRKR
jgi:TFIIE alpha subunit